MKSQCLVNTTNFINIKNYFNHFINIFSFFSTLWHTFVLCEYILSHHMKTNDLNITINVQQMLNHKIDGDRFFSKKKSSSMFC
jgi:hypothetical protein